MSSKKAFIAIAAALLLAASSAAWAVDLSNVVGTVKGTVKDTDGKPLAGVVVSDGYTAVATAEDGTYSFQPNAAAYYVHCSIPAEYEVPIRQGQPVIFKKIDDRAKSYDFILKPLRGGKEEEFSLFVIGDPQCQNIHHVDRMRTEAIPDIKAYARKQKGNSYALTLGDIGYTEGGRNTNYLLPIIRNEMAADKAGMPVFQTVGNHDFEFAKGDLDKNNPTPSLRRDRMYEAVFGPANYSWNRGDVHFISMNNVHFKDLVKAGNYAIGTSDEQLEWLRQDLSYVPKNKMVVLSVHIPIYGKKAPKSHEVVKMLGEFENALVLSGHTHTNFKNVHENGVPEYTVGALSGCWWWSKNCADGSPNGYLVMHFQGNKVKDHIYKATGYKDNFQMRIYRGDAVFGGKYEKFPLKYGHNALLVNIWNWEKGCRLEVYENGKLTKTITEPIPATKELETTSNGSKDWWAIGYHIGVVGRGLHGNRKDYASMNYHMFKYDIQNPDAKIKMVFCDNYGRRFTETHIFETSEYGKYADPPQYNPESSWLY